MPQACLWRPMEGAVGGTPLPAGSVFLHNKGNDFNFYYQYIY